MKVQLWYKNPSNMSVWHFDCNWSFLRYESASVLENYRCRDSNYTQSNFDTFTLDCQGTYSCSNVILNCTNDIIQNNACNVNCDGFNSCNNMKIYAKWGFNQGV